MPLVRSTQESCAQVQFAANIPSISINAEKAEKIIEFFQHVSQQGLSNQLGNSRNIISIPAGTTMIVTDLSSRKSNDSSSSSSEIKTGINFIIPCSGINKVITHFIELPIKEIEKIKKICSVKANSIKPLITLSEQTLIEVVREKGDQLEQTPIEALREESSQFSMERETHVSSLFIRCFPCFGKK